MVIFMWAQDLNFTIGKQDKMPWHVKEEMQFFVQTTKNQNIVMGRVTYDSIPLKPLKNKKSVNVLSKQVRQGQTNEKYYSDFEQILANTSGDLYVIGGYQIFQMLKKYVDCLYISQIKQKYAGDLFMDHFLLGQYKITLFNHNFKLKQRQYFSKFNFYQYDVEK